jgi:predicted acyltransferase
MRKRFEELDILRGLSVIGMVLVIMPGAWEHRFNWLNHAAWAGIPPLSDMIFPTFLFCIGFALPISFRRRFKNGDTSSKIIKHIFIRTVLLIVVGIFLNAFPFFDFENVRLPGILQRIGVCWFVGAMLLLYGEKFGGKHKFQFQLTLLSITALVFLIGYWMLLYFIPVAGYDNAAFDSVGSWPAYIDRAVFGVNHLWPYGTTEGIVTYDPEGILSTIPACVNVIFGAILGLLYLNDSKHFNWQKSAGVGITLIFLGLLLHYVELVPIIKKIWTSSFALLSIGFSMLLMALISLVLKIKNASIILQPAKIFGGNALLVFIITTMAGSLMDIPFFGGSNGPVSFRALAFIYISAIVSNPQYASLIYTLIFLLIFYFILSILYKKNMHIKL